MPASKKPRSESLPLHEDRGGEDGLLPDYLLDPADIVRDPLHGDIELSALERFIIDQPEFQRLRGITQLGLTYISYPGAVHNRYLHSLGTLHVAQQMIATCTSNAQTHQRRRGARYVPLGIGRYATILARACALMHDMAHVSFGHTFEKEARVFLVDEWKDKARCDRVFDTRKGGFKERVVGYLTAQHDVHVDTATTLVEDIKAVLTCGKSDVERLPYPFVHDLVGNTICADLIDYVQRDMYFTGLSERFGNRFLNYLAVVPLDKETRRVIPTSGTAVAARHSASDNYRNRVVLLTYRYNERGDVVEKHDIVAEAIDLVRRRGAVAEKLYFHRTKMAASAMLAVAAQAHELTAEEIWDSSDVEVLRLLRDRSPSARARTLAAAIFDRQVYKPFFRVPYVEKGHPRAHALWEVFYPKYSDPGPRLELILKIERAIAHAFFQGNEERASGMTAASCPDKNMNLKGFDMLVLPRPDMTVESLQLTAHRPSKKEIEGIQLTHLSLWRFEIYLHPSIIVLDRDGEFRRELSSKLEQELGFPNELITPAPGALDGYTADLEVENALRSHGLSRMKLTGEQFGELRAAHRSGSSWKDVMTERLAAWGLTGRAKLD